MSDDRGAELRTVPEEGRHGEVTEILARIHSGDEQMLARLYELVYEPLRTIAAAQLAQIPHNSQWQPTMVVHSAFLQLIDQRRVEWQNRRHFHRVAALAMRRILTDWARRESAEKRGGAAIREHNAEIEWSPKVTPDLILDLDAALERLALAQPRCAAVVELRFFGGLMHQEVAAALGVAQRTVEADWQFARTWLHEQMSQ